MWQFSSYFLDPEDVLDNRDGLQSHPIDLVLERVMQSGHVLNAPRISRLQYAAVDNTHAFTNRMRFLKVTSVAYSFSCDRFFRDFRIFRIKGLDFIERVGGLFANICNCGVDVAVCAICEQASTHFSTFFLLLRLVELRAMYLQQVTLETRALQVSSPAL